MKRYFHHELQDLRSKVILLGEKAIDVSRIAIDGFLERDMEKIQQALKLDDAIDDLEVEIDRMAVRYCTLRGPVSSDMRLIFVAIKASHDLERAGDEAHSIAKKARNILLRGQPASQTANIEKMSHLALDMMRDAITCFVEEDLQLAETIFKRDEEVDRLNKDNFTLLSKGNDDSEEAAATRLETILISKSIERIADHAKNLAEEVIYLLTGK
jgi:phosphate transport system protein